MTAHLMVANEDCCGPLGVCSCRPGFICLVLGAAIHPLLSKVGNAAHAACMSGPLQRMILHLIIWVCWIYYPHAGISARCCMQLRWPPRSTLCHMHSSLVKQCQAGALRLPACWPAGQSSSRARTCKPVEACQDCVHAGMLDTGLAALRRLLNTSSQGRRPTVVNTWSQAVQLRLQRQH